MEVAFYLGPLAIHWYGIFITSAVIAAISITIVEAKRHKRPIGQVLWLAGRICFRRFPRLAGFATG
jgi:prolipoprotein diacylglyceryltransferase